MIGSIQQLLGYSLLETTDTRAARGLRPLSGPWCFFRRIRCLVGGQLIEDIDYYNRTHEMFHCLTDRHTRENDDTEAFGARVDAPAYYDVAGNSTASAANYPGMSPGSQRTVYFKPLLGILNQSKFLPIRYCPMTIELELVNNLTDPIIDPATDTRVGTDAVWTAANSSTLWQITNVQAKMDVCTLDNTLDNEYAQHVLSGKVLPIKLQHLHHATAVSPHFRHRSQC